MAKRILTKQPVYFAELRMLTYALRDYADKIDTVLDRISGQAMKDALTEQDRAEEKIKELEEEIRRRQQEDEGKK
jgi:hypothetical protein